jgi:soluble lytic murein transglycosylase-like protein
MIEKIAMPLWGAHSAKGISGASQANPQGSSFLELLHHELSPSQPIDRLFLDYLIKTIQSILTRQNKINQFSFFPVPSWSYPGDSNSLPGLEKTSLSAVAIQSDEKSNVQKFDEIIQGAADRYGLDPALIKAVISVESNGNPTAVSPAGAQGLMQLMPKTAADLGVTDPFDPVQNVKAGTRYLSQLISRYQGNLQLALAAYNWGMGNLEKNPNALPKETRNYIARVQNRHQTYLDASSTG